MRVSSVREVRLRISHVFVFLFFCVLGGRGAGMGGRADGVSFNL